MLNYFYWYVIIASIIPILYIIPITDFNSPLNVILIILIILSIVISIFLGKKYNDRFTYADLEYKKSKYEYIPLLVVVLIAIIEFTLSKDIPFLTVTIRHINKYQEFEFIPFVHVFSCVIGLYYSSIYVHKFISYKKNRLLNIFAYLLINIIMLLYNMRSFLMFSVFILINFLLAKYKKRKNKIGIAKTIGIIFSICLLLFGFGCFGNLRQGYKLKNSSYIEKIGLYKMWPGFLPKQYMWTYSYVTSPLANLNYNVNSVGSNIKVGGFITQIIPETFSKRLINSNDINKCELKKKYFTVSTGYCGSYANMGFIGMSIFWLFTMLLPVLFFKYSIEETKRKEYFAFLSISLCCVVFMFFTNTFSYAGTSLTLWLSIILLSLKNRKK